MNFGYQIWALRVYRRQETGYGTLIDGFSMAGRVLLMELYIFGCTLCWALAFGTAGGLALLLLEWLPPVLLVLLIYGAGFGIALWISYRYAMAPFLLMDRPEAGAIAPVRESVAMMQGWKWEYFKLDFSFFGWYLLNAPCLWGWSWRLFSPPCWSCSRPRRWTPPFWSTGWSCPGPPRCCPP